MSKLTIADQIIEAVGTLQDNNGGKVSRVGIYRYIGDHFYEVTPQKKKLISNNLKKLVTSGKLEQVTTQSFALKKVEDRNVSKSKTTKKNIKVSTISEQILEALEILGAIRGGPEKNWNPANSAQIMEQIETKYGKLTALRRTLFYKKLHELETTRSRPEIVSYAGGYLLGNIPIKKSKVEHKGRRT